MRTKMIAILGALSVVGVLAACADSTGPVDQAQGSPAAADELPTGSITNGRVGPLAVPLTTIQLVPPARNPAFPAATGKASFQAQKGQRELQIEVEDIPQGTVVLFYLAGKQVGTQQTADATGAASIDLNTHLGDVVPRTVAGKRVKVKTAAGLVVVRGSF